MCSSGQAAGRYHLPDTGNKQSTPQIPAGCSLADMRTPGGVLKAPPYFPKGTRRQLREPSTAEIDPLDFAPSVCRQNEQGEKALSDRNLRRELASKLKLSKAVMEKALEARDEDHSTFRHVFGIHGNTIEVFFEVDSHGKRAPATPPHNTLDENESLGSAFKSVDVGEHGFYVAMDKNFVKIFVIFGSGLKLVYGEDVGQYIADKMTSNIMEYAAINPPKIPKDIRHKQYEKWLLENPHLCWPPSARMGVYHWGVWMEHGHNHLPSVITSDTNVLSRMEPALWSLFKSMGALTRAQRILLSVVDAGCLREYNDILRDIPEAHRRCFQTDPEECFALRACLVNVFTEPHVDGGDVKNGWATMSPFGRYEQGDFCVTELKRRFVYKVGSVCFLKSQRFEHFTLQWNGYRYCLVATVHEAIKSEHLSH